MYENGEGCIQNFAESLKWYLNAAKQGHAQAQYCVAVDYDLGVGVDVNYSEALKWYTRSAEQGFFEAISRTAIFYELGLGTEKNVNRAIYWYKKGLASGEYNANERMIITRMQLIDKLNKQGQFFSVNYDSLPPRVYIDINSPIPF